MLWGQEGQLLPLSFSIKGRVQELRFMLTYFHRSYLVKGHFPALQTVWLKKIFLGAIP